MPILPVPERAQPKAPALQCLSCHTETGPLVKLVANSGDGLVVEIHLCEPCVLKHSPGQGAMKDPPPPPL